MQIGHNESTKILSSRITSLEEEVEPMRTELLELDVLKQQLDAKDRYIHD
jgi:hypothetical protein